MREKDFVSSVGKNSRRLALCLMIIYGSLLSLTFISYQDEILPLIVESEFLIGDEDIDHSPHIQIVRFSQSKLRTNARPFCGWVLNKNLQTSKSQSGVFVFRKFLISQIFHKHRSTSVLLSVFRI